MPASPMPNEHTWGSCPLLHGKPARKQIWRWAVTERSLASSRHSAGKTRCASVCWELLILALYRDGRQAEALRAYAGIRDRLVDELGIDPSVSLRELEARVLAQDPTLALSGPTASASGSRDRTVAGNLREQLSTFVGRQSEFEQLSETVRTHRLVTLVGPGGVGKTRLAVEVAASLCKEHRDGAWLVDLASVTEPEGVAPAVAGALEAAASSLGSPHSPGSTEELILHHLAGQSLIVVLDNCEQVIDRAAELAEILVGAVPGLRLIATSRQPLGVPGEVLVPVAGLPEPAAVELFVDRARAVQPGFSTEGNAGQIVSGCVPPFGWPSPGHRARCRSASRPSPGDPGATAR